MTTASPPASLSFANISTNVGSHVATKEGNLNTYITNLGADPSTSDLINMQRHITEWSVIVDLNSTLNKTLADTMKGVVQKSG